MSASIGSFAAIGSVCAHETGGVHRVLPPLWPYHSVLVAAGALVLIGAMFWARNMKSRKTWLKNHKALALSGVCLVLIGVIVAVYMVITYMDTYLAKGSHAYIGILATVLVIFTPLMGFAQLRSEDGRLRIIHRWSGRLAIAVLLANIVVGWLMVSRA